MARYFLSTPIYYVNDVPHVGHAYTTIAADTLTRARRLQGQDAFFLTGTDEHGQNIERIARERGIPEQQHCDEIAAQFKELWGRLDIRFDDFIRTTEPRHRRGVLALWGRLRSAKTPDGQDAVYRGKYKGWYCPRCESFKDEEELRQPGNLCPDHERPCEWTEEENFFFRLSSYADWLRSEIESDRIRIEPPARKNEVLGVIRGGLQDFSVSRARVKWGIPVQEQPDHVLYVWVDALANYITALGFGEQDPYRRKLYEHYWAGSDAAPEAQPQRLHLIGKDIIRFHCLYWPALLKAAGVPVPTRFFGQGWITKNGKKLSKSTGNVIDPVQLVKEYGADAVRHFLLREGTYGQDWDFTDTAFVTRFNADLANDLGNLVSRTLTMTRNYCGGKIPATTEPRGGASQGSEVFARYEALDFSGALIEIWNLIGAANQEIVSFEPWAVAKDPARKAELDAFLYRQLERVRLIATLVSPVMPGASARILRMLGLDDRVALGPGDLVWGVLEPGRTQGNVETLFPRLEKASKKESSVSDSGSSAGPATPGSAPTPAGDKIDIADFAKVELCVARIIQAEKIAGSKKLIKLSVDVGTETRQVVAGIAEAYAPEALVGKTIALVANLKPAKLMGVESNGMILAASLDGKPVLCTFDADVPAGTRIK